MRGAQEFECCDELDTIEIPEHKIITNIDIASVLTKPLQIFLTALNIFNQYKTHGLSRILISCSPKKF